MNIEYITGLFYWGFVSRAQKELNKKFQLHMTGNKSFYKNFLLTSNELPIRKARTHITNLLRFCEIVPLLLKEYFCPRQGFLEN
jgi:hypothetical protein